METLVQKFDSPVGHGKPLLLSALEKHKWETNTEDMDATRGKSPVTEDGESSESEAINLSSRGLKFGIDTILAERDTEESVSTSNPSECAPCDLHFKNLDYFKLISESFICKAMNIVNGGPDNFLDFNKLSLDSFVQNTLAVSPSQLSYQGLRDIHLDTQSTSATSFQPTDLSLSPRTIKSSNSSASSSSSYLSPNSLHEQTFTLKTPAKPNGMRTTRARRTQLPPPSEPINQLPSSALEQQLIDMTTVSLLFSTCITKYFNNICIP